MPEVLGKEAQNRHDLGLSVEMLIGSRNSLLL